MIASEKTSKAGGLPMVSVSDSPRPAVPRRCPLCSRADSDDLGPILHPAPTRIAGVRIDLAGWEFRLRACGSCGMQYKDPLIPEEKLIECYRRVESTYYGMTIDPRSRRFDDIKTMLESHLDVPSHKPRVLDVGCFNGALLEHLGRGWDRFGVDPCGPATEIARQRGATILGETLEAIPADIEPFDAITAIDIAEHVVDPLAFFRGMSRLLRVGGVLITVTGDSDAARWRWQRGLYWYCIIPEHVSFYNERSMRAIGKQTGLVTIEHARKSHQRESPKHAAAQTLKNYAYMAARAFGGFGVGRVRRAVRERGAPGWMSSPDHMFHVMRRA